LVLANAAPDAVPHDPYSVVGHFHYVPSLGAVYTIYAASHNYWMMFLFMINRSVVDVLGRIHSMGFSISPNPIFFSMHSIGIFGFPRRISDYPVLFSRFHWLNAFGLVGVALPMFFLLSPFLFKLRLRLPLITSF